MAVNETGKPPPSSAKIAAWVGLGLASGLGMVFAAWGMLSPTMAVENTFPAQDKVIHALVFACITGPAVIVLPRRYVVFWMVHMAAFGGGVEIVQGLMHAGRTASLWDFLADLVGIAAATVVGREVRTRLLVMREAVRRVPQST